MTLTPEHLADLRASGLSDATIEMMGVYSMDVEETKKFLGGWIPPNLESALAFPYFDREGIKTSFVRIKVFPPYKKEGEGTIKYLQFKNTPPRLYFLPPVIDVLDEPAIPISIIEGEKKAACVVQGGVMAVGLSGLWNWVKGGTYQLIADFDRLTLWQREITIVPDSDAWSGDKSKMLRRAIYALHRELKRKGAKNFYVKLPETS